MCIKSTTTLFILPFILQDKLSPIQPEINRNYVTKVFTLEQQPWGLGKEHVVSPPGHEHPQVSTMWCQVGHVVGTRAESRCCRDLRKCVRSSRVLLANCAKRKRAVHTRATNDTRVSHEKTLLTHIDSPYKPACLSR